MTPPRPWPPITAAFDAPSRRVRAVFPGDAEVPDDHAGVLELNVFEVTSRRGRRPSRRAPGSSCCRFRRRRGHTEPACGSRPRWPATARQSIDTTQDGNPSGCARPGRAACLAHPRSDYQERVANRPPGAKPVIADVIPVRTAQNAGAICAHSISLSARQMAVPNRRYICLRAFRDRCRTRTAWQASTPLAVGFGHADQDSPEGEV
jgi:hypothetical protein